MSQECAVWYRRYDTSIDFDLFDSEEEAAEFAAHVSDSSSDYPAEIVGVQFADGRTVRAVDWAAYPEAVTKTRERLQAHREAWHERPTRTITDPFEGKSLTIDAEDPEWVGVQGADLYVAEEKT